MKLAVEHVTFASAGATIIDDISLNVRDGQFVGVIGPNGSGKSTLLKTASRLLKPNFGTVLLHNEDLYTLSPKKAAQEMAVVSQESSLSFDFSVEEMVMMGRNPHKKLFQFDTAEDRLLVEEALERVGLLGYEDRSFLSLSGGEKQRVFIARALAQQASMIILDEPTNHLDIRHQLQLMNLIRTLNVTVLAALHDLNLAAVYCDYLYVMAGGEVKMSGRPEKVLTRESIRDVFGVETEVTIHPATKKPHITFLAHV